MTTMRTTTEQADLFLDLAYDRPSQPFDTSEAAAAAMRGTAGSLRARVLVAVWRRPMTQDECEIEIGRRGNTVHPRFWELEHRGLVYKSELRRVTRSGRQACVYHVTERGAIAAAIVAETGVEP